MDGFLGIGFWEIILVFAVILALIGPRRLPQIAAKLGRTFSQLKRASSDLTSTLAKEVEGESQGEEDKLKGSLDSLKAAASDLKNEFIKGADAETVDTGKESSKDISETKPQD